MAGALGWIVGNPEGIQFGVAVAYRRVRLKGSLKRFTHLFDCTHPYALKVTSALIPIASRISCNRDIATV